jgi:hypothetical protein
MLSERELAERRQRQGGAGPVRQLTLEGKRLAEPGPSHLGVAAVALDHPQDAQRIGDGMAVLRLTSEAQGLLQQRSGPLGLPAVIGDLPQL